MKAVLIALAATLLAGSVLDATIPTSAQESYEIRKPFRRNGPGYARLQKSDTIATRKFRDPALGPNAQGQPFDNGFFFESPRGPYGGTSPYMH